jgi:hypothetical protein
MRVRSSVWRAYLDSRNRHFPDKDLRSCALDKRCCGGLCRRILRRRKAFSLTMPGHPARVTFPEKPHQVPTDPLMTERPPKMARSGGRPVEIDRQTGAGEPSPIRNKTDQETCLDLIASPTANNLTKSRTRGPYFRLSSAPRPTCRIFEAIACYRSTRKECLDWN